MTRRECIRNSNAFRQQQQTCSLLFGKVPNSFDFWTSQPKIPRQHLLPLRVQSGMQNFERSRSRRRNSQSQIPTTSARWNNAWLTYSQRSPVENLVRSLRRPRIHVSQLSFEVVTWQPREVETTSYWTNSSKSRHSWSWVIFYLTRQGLKMGSNVSIAQR